MGIQQLDMFAAFDAPVKEKLPEVSVVAEAPVVASAIETIIAEEPVVPAEAGPFIPEEPEYIAPSTSPQPGPLIFVDDKIGIKIKSRVAVQMPKPQSQPVTLQQNNSTVAVKPKSKRGRKSYKEIDAELDLVEVPEDEVLQQKMYYSITEVAKWFKVNASLLRYWENEFDILKPRKNRKGDRLFRPEDIKNLQVIYYLLRNRKFSLEGAKKYLRNNRHQADVNIQLAQSLTKFRSFLLELKANLGT
jgi:DNA-binding transcriptional MerR regulator